MPALRATIIVVPSLFDPPAPESIPDSLHAYAAHLEERDGAPDFERRILAARERDTARFESAPACWDRPFDVALFERQLRRYDTSAPTSREMQVLLCMVKINANEAYGVERARGRVVEQDGMMGWLHRVVLLEETYHTRLLLSARKLFGAPVADAGPPLFLTRTLVSTILSVPDAVARPVTLAAEAVGVATFLRLIGAVRRVFADRPELRDSLEERVVEVLIDEIGHVSFNRLIAPWGTFAALRALLAAVAIGTRGGSPEAEQLGILPLPVRDVWDLDPAKLPEEVRRRAFIA
jgi:hypothetical protein